MRTTKRRISASSNNERQKCRSDRASLRTVLPWSDFQGGICGLKAGDAGETHKKTADAYSEMWSTANGHGEELRMEKSRDMVNHFYDLVTDFYEYGWGQSFHFCRLFTGDSFGNCILRHEDYLALKLGLKKGAKVLDVGCGVGGPMRNIARLTSASILGINNNRAQVARTNAYASQTGLSPLCAAQHGDFLAMPFAECSFDAAYSIEATCHAPALVRVFREIHRVLKPGALYANYEWCTTARYDPADAEQAAIIRGIEEGDSLPKLVSTEDAVKAAIEAGFEVVETEDLAEMGPGQEPWWSVLAGEYSYQRTFDGFFKCALMAPWGRAATDKLSRALELLRIAPAGTVKAHEVLELAARNLVEGGRREIFTPMFFMLLRKPAA
ncbi:sterol 24-C-methyltransferase [Hyaloraphidium curvatum]|nr:sterol 24-C-methyltransferase [Hyaloraphidium curvatum]